MHTGQKVTRKKDKFDDENSYNNTKRNHLNTYAL